MGEIGASADALTEDIQDSEDPLVPDRTCGTCTLCCKVYPVAELNKPAGTWCIHLAPGKGCTYREHRPHICHQFFCGWRQDPNLGPEWKPEKSRFVLSVAREYSAVVVTVDPGMPLAWKKEPYYSRLKVWAERAFLENKRIVVLVSGQATVVLPDRDVPIGALAPGDEIVIYREGAVYGAERRQRKGQELAASDRAGG
jgi:hypothetical protein